MGTALGIAIAVAIVHARSLDKSLMPWIITSQTIPILAIAPMVIVVLASIGLRGLVPKALISTYLSFFPVTVGMVKGLRSPDPILLDLMRTYNASRAQIFFKLRVPASVPFLFASMKVAIAISLVGAIVGELPTGAVAGIGSRLLFGSYYSQTIQMWSALIAASVMAGGAGHARRPRRPSGAASDGRAMNGRPSQILYPAVVDHHRRLRAPRLRGGPAVMGSPLGVVAGILALAGLISLWHARWQLLLTGVAAHAAAFALIRALPDVAGKAGLGYWVLVVAAWLTAWAFVQALSALRPRDPWVRRLVGVAIPFVFGLWVLILWEIVVRGFAVPLVLLPPPSLIWQKLISSGPTLLADFRQTFLKAVLFGYTVGCLSGFVVAILADRVPFLRRGLLPVGNLVSALPIIGIAPIMVIWFGFDWPSKAAVVIVMTFFPMLVNTIAGLSATEAMERDLMRTYAAGYWQTLLKLRLPAALPFIFNALKDQLNSCPDRGHRGRILRHADRWDGFSHLHRGRPHGNRYGLGGNRHGRARGLAFLRIGVADRTRGNVLAPVLPGLTP